MFDALRHFLLIVEHGTFTEAARRAHLSQPALSASIRRLEQHFGAQLLSRGRKGSELTAAGAALVPRARAALAAVGDGERAVAEVAELHAGEVRIGGGATVCTYFLPPYLAAFRRAHPRITFRVREATADDVVAALHDGELDLGLVTSDLGEPWRDDELVLIAAPGVDAEAAPFVTFAHGTTTRALLDATFPGAHIVMELNSIAAVKAHVRVGLGKALVSRVAVETDLALRRLVLVPDVRTPVRRTLRVLHRGLDRLTPAAAALRELLFSDLDAPGTRSAKSHPKRGRRPKRKMPSRS
jgi:DNA-binding transcriptional LysR family regulator